MFIAKLLINLKLDRIILTKLLVPAKVQKRPQKAVQTTNCSPWFALIYRSYLNSFLVFKWSNLKQFWEFRDRCSLLLKTAKLKE